MQRYENKSKSQPHVNSIKNIDGCLRLCKDTKIKANHNGQRANKYIEAVV